VSWTAPGDEGSPVTGYTASDGVGDTCTTTDGALTTCTVMGLTNGTAYTFTVTATNANGTGPASDPSSAVTPSSAPDAPTGVTAVAGKLSATVSWTAAGDEGSPVTGYTVSDGVGNTCTSSSATTCTVSGLTSDTSYTFTVTATNADGTGPASDPSAGVTPTNVPDAPTDVVAVAGNGQATVSWTAPSDNGLPITGYTVLSTSGHTCTTSATSCVLTGLPNGASQSFAVRATNADGTGPASASSNTVVPSSNTAVITSGSSATIAAGRNLVFTVMTSGTPTPTITAPGIPSWLTLTPGIRSKAGTARLAGKGPVTGGTFTFRVDASNGAGVPTEQVFTVHVLAITSASSVTFHKGVAGSFTVTTAGIPSGLSLTAVLPRKLSGLVFHDNGDGTATLSGTPAATDTTTNLTVRATGGSVVTTKKLTVTIA
jgi:hypothetical protein